VLKIQCFIDKIITAIQTLRDSGLFKFLCDRIISNTRQKSYFSTVVCLGVGNFSTSTSSFWQFVLYLCLRKYLLLQSGEVETDSIILHDIFGEKINEESFLFEPNISEFEKSVCKSLGVHICQQNLFGQYKLPTAINNDSVLYFMPHCPYQLYCNLIWTNCTELDRLYILGNR